MMRQDVPSWDEYFRAIAEQVKTRSKDPRMQIGAVIVDRDNQIVATGYNDLPRGARNLPERFLAPEKYDWMVHAEENAIGAAARRGVKTAGSSIYLSEGYFCCHKCASAIVQAGIKTVHAPAPDYTKEEFKFGLAMQRLTEASVQMWIYPPVKDLDQTV
jgi:dCMP deaminase